MKFRNIYFSFIIFILSASIVNAVGFFYYDSYAQKFVLNSNLLISNSGSFEMNLKSIQYSNNTNNIGDDLTISSKRSSDLILDSDGDAIEGDVFRVWGNVSDIKQLFEVKEDGSMQLGKDLANGTAQNRLRFLGGYNTTDNYIQVGASSSDSNGKLIFSRNSTTNSSFANFDVYATSSNFNGGLNNNKEVNFASGTGQNNLVSLGDSIDSVGGIDDGIAPLNFFGSAGWGTSYLGVDSPNGELYVYKYSNSGNFTTLKVTGDVEATGTITATGGLVGSVDWGSIPDIPGYISNGDNLGTLPTLNCNVYQVTADASTGVRSSCAADEKLISGWCAFDNPTDDVTYVSPNSALTNFYCRTNSDGQATATARCCKF